MQFYECRQIKSRASNGQKRGFVTKQNDEYTNIARPFNTTFNRQIKSAQSLYGRQIGSINITTDKMNEVLDELLPYYPERDRELIRKRVITTILTRMKAMEG